MGEAKSAMIERERRILVMGRRIRLLVVGAMLVIVGAVVLQAMMIGEDSVKLATYDGKEVVILERDKNKYRHREFLKGEVFGADPKVIFRQGLVEQGKAIRGKRELAGRKLVALTFDDGPGVGTTERLLNILKSKKVYATFFMLGSRVEVLPKVAKRVRDEGHEIANHSYSHQDLSRISLNEAKWEITRTEDIFDNILGGKASFIRSPYGTINLAAFKQTGMPDILWDVDTLDWKNRNAESVRAMGVTGARDGAVILMHDLYDSTVDGAAMMIDDLRARGYEFVTVSEMAEAKGKKLVPGELYYGF